VVDGVAVLAEDQGLGADLDALGLPGALGDLRGFAALGVDGDGDAGLDLDEVHLGDEAFTEPASQWGRSAGGSVSDSEAGVC